MAEEQIKIDVEAEKRVLSSFIDPFEYVTTDDKVKSSFIEVELPESEPINLSDSLPQITPDEPKKMEVVGGSDDWKIQFNDLAHNFNKLKNSIEKGLPQNFESVYKTIENVIDQQNKMASQVDERLTINDQRYAFDDRQQQIKNPPSWI